MLVLFAHAGFDDLSVPRSSASAAEVAVGEVADDEAESGEGTELLVFDAPCSESLASLPRA